MFFIIWNPAEAWSSIWIARRRTFATAAVTHLRQHTATQKNKNKCDENIFDKLLKKSKKQKKYNNDDNKYCMYWQLFVIRFFRVAGFCTGLFLTETMVSICREETSKPRPNLVVQIEMVLYWRVRNEKMFDHYTQHSVFVSSDDLNRRFSLCSMGYFGCLVVMLWWVIPLK